MLTGNQPSPPARPQPNISTYKGQDRALHAGRIGTFGLFFSIVAASAPLTAVAGGITTTFAVTGVIGTPLTFLVLGVVLALFGIGYAEMSHHVHNAGAFYAYVARGLGGTMGTASAIVALVAYNSIQAGIYGMFGSFTSGLIEQWWGVKVSWWIIALVGIAVVGVLGANKIDISAKVLGVLLVLECLLVLIVDISFVGDPGPAGVSFEALNPSSLSGAGVGAALCFGVAAFMGFESAAVYAEEARRPQKAVGRATLWAVGFTAVFYALSGWAMTVASGPGKVVGAAQKQGADLLFHLGSARLGGAVGDLMSVLFVTSLFAALLSFHNAVARYFFAMGREGVLPGSVGRASRNAGAPSLGSFMQTTIAVVLIAAFAAAGKDPVLDLFTWMGNVGAIGLILMMAVTSVAVVVFFVRRNAAAAQKWRILTSLLSTVLLAAILVLSVAKFDVLLGTSPNSPLRWVLPGLIGAAAVIGIVWGRILKATRPDAHARIGLGKEAFQLERESEVGGS